jgi:hypothetical protein
MSELLQDLVPYLLITTIVCLVTNLVLIVYITKIGRRFIVVHKVLHTHEKFINDLFNKRIEKKDVYN